MKKKILIPMLIIMITVVSVGFAAWNIINQEKTRVPSEYFPYSVDYEQESVYDGTYQDIDIKFDNLDISLENSNLVILYYKYTYSVNEETGKVSHSLDKLDGKPKNHGTYIAKVYQKNGSEASMDPISIANPYTEICNVRFDILQREVRVTALDEEIYFGQSKSDVTFDYVIEEADGDRGLIAGDTLDESSNFSLDVAYNTYDDAKDYDITISGLTNSDNNYNISYVPGTFTVKKLPISFTWDKTSTVYNGSYQRPTVVASTTINIDLDTVIANSSVDVIYNTDYNGQSTLIDANLNGYDVSCVGINNQNYEVVNYPNNINYVIDQYPVDIKWENSEFTFNGKLQYQKANIITPLFYNEKDSKDDICNINYDTNGMINANVDKDGKLLPNNSQYMVNIIGISNSNYKINSSYLDYLSYAYYDIKPKLLTLAWPKENVFEYNNEEKIVQVLSEDIVSGYPSGLYYEGHQENANFVDANTQIEGSSKYYSVANITSTNYYLLDENATCEFRITQKEVFMNWDSKTQFEYAGQWEEGYSARKLHCPTGYLSEVIPGTDAGLSISGGQTNANHNHEGIKYDNFDDYVAVASISNSNYKLISNTTKAFEIWAYQAEVVIDNTKENAILFTPFNTNGYDTLIYTYEASDFTPNASVTTHIFAGDICTVNVELLNALGNYQLSVKDAGSYIAETTGLSNPNYSMVVKEYLNVVIEPKEINVLWGTDLENINDDLIFEYNSYSQIPVAVLDGVWDDDINDVSISVDSSYAKTNANVNRNKTPELISGKDYYTVSLTSDDDGYLLSGDRAFNYKFASTDECQATFMIKQAQLTISSKEKSITYGEAPSITEEDRVITGLKGTDTLDVLVGLSSYVSYRQYDNVTDLDNGRTYYSVWQNVNNTNYEITYEEADFIVNKLDVTINWYGDTTKVYYGEEWAPSVELVGLVNNDPVTCVRDGLEKDANIGNEKYTASVTGLESDNGKHVNYNVTNLNNTQYFTITPRKITVAWSGYSNLEYNGDNHEITDTPTNIVPKDQNNIGYLVTYYNGTVALDAAPINAGTAYSAKATVESTNYYIEEANSKQPFEIAKRKISIAWSGYSNLEYNGDNHEITAIPSNIVDKDQNNIGYVVTYYNGTEALDDAPINAGKAYSAKATITSENYYIEEANSKQPFEIAKRKISIAWSGYSNLEYNGDNHEITAIPSNIVDKDQNNIGYVVTYYNGTEALDDAPINAGKAYSAKATITSANYYIETSNATQTFEIAKRKLTINWTAPTNLIYDGNNKTYSTTLSNVVDGEQDAIGFAVNYYQEANLLGTTAPKNAGTSYSAQATITSENYYIEEGNTTQTFDIAKRRLTINWTAPTSLTYDGNNKTYSTTLSNVVDGEQDKIGFAVNYYQEANLLGTTAPKNAGTSYSAKATITSENYYIEEANSKQIFEIAKRRLEITWVSEKTYNKTPLLPDYTFSNLVDGDLSSSLGIAFTGEYSSGVTNVLYDQNGNVRANLYILSLTGDNAVNYQLPTETIDFTVLPVPVEVTWNVDDLKYIASDIHPASIASGIIPGDTYTLSYNQQIKNAGTYENIVVTIDNRNYVITNGATIALITVDKAKLEISTNPTLATIYEGETSRIIGGAAAINGGKTIVTKDGYFVFDPNGSNGSDKKYYGSGKTALHDDLRVKFVPNSDVAYNYYESDFVTVQMLIQAEASVGYQGTYYAKIEDAIDATLNATSETIIYVLPIESDPTSYSPTISRNCTISSKVTLLLPHTSSQLSADQFGGYYTKLLDGETPKDENGTSILYYDVMALLTIDEGIEVIVNGKLNVAANLYSTGNTGIHAVLINNGKITVNGSIYSYGFIKGTGNIHVTSTATYTDVFRIYNWSGGKNAYALNNNKILPFNVYSFHNVSCDMRIDAGGLFQAYANIDADNSWMLDKMIVFVGNSSSESYFFKLESGYVNKKSKDSLGDDSYKTDYTISNQLARQKEVLEVYGNMVDGQISIEASISKSGISIPINITTSTDLPVPIGFLEIHAMSGVINVSKSSYQFLPGSYLYVNKGAKFIVGSNVKARFYDEFNDDYEYIHGENGTAVPGYTVSHTSYRYHHTDWYALKGSLGDEFGGRILIDGHFECNGSISGNIQGGKNGRLDVYGDTSTNIPLLAKLHYDGTKFLFVVQISSASTKKDPQNIIGNINGVPNQTFTKGNTYYYNSQKECWGTGTSTISFETNCSQPINEYTVYGSSAGHIIPDTVLNSLKDRDHYAGYKWYTDSTFTTEYTGQTLYSNTTLYAKWLGEEYTVSFDSNGGESVESIKVIYAEQYGALPELSREGFYFEGWTYNGEIINNSSIVTATSNHTLVAKWQQITAESHNVNLYIEDGEEPWRTIPRIKGSQIGSLEIPSKTGYTFAGWVYEDNSPVNSTDIVDEDINIYASWTANTYTVTFDKTTGETAGTTSSTVTYGSIPEKLATLPTKTGYTFTGYYTAETGGEKYYNGDGSGAKEWDLTQNTRLYAQWSANTYTVTLNANGGSVTPSSITVTYGGKYSNLPTPNRDGNTFDGWKYNNDVITNDTEVTIASDHTLTAQWKQNSGGGGSCFASGVMINMADGTLKAIEDIRVGDQVLVMNHLTGKVEISVISINVHDSVSHQYYDVLDLEFSNGTMITIANDHGFYDITLGRYVAISLTNYHEYLGHEFYYYDVSSNVASKVTLVNGTIENRYCQVFAPFTYEHLNLFAEGLLTLTGEVVELYNAFEFDETVAYDKEAMEADIEKYGLYTYEDFKDYATEEEFNAFNAKYFKVAVGKGYLTYEQVLYYIQTYLRD